MFPLKGPFPERRVPEVDLWEGNQFGPKNNEKVITFWGHHGENGNPTRGNQKVTRAMRFGQAEPRVKIVPLGSARRNPSGIIGLIDSLALTQQIPDNPDKGNCFLGDCPSTFWWCPLKLPLFVILKSAEPLVDFEWGGSLFSVDSSLEGNTGAPA